MDIIQTFYDNLASQYDKRFQDWHATTREQEVILDKLFHLSGFDWSAKVLSCVYRATRREELTSLLIASGCSEVTWTFPDKTGFYQPIVMAKKILNR